MKIEGLTHEMVDRVLGISEGTVSFKQDTCLTSQPLQATFPAHRLFYDSQFNVIHILSNRAEEIIQFHIDRCRDILNIIDNKQAGIEDIAIQHFPPSLLAGTGKSMAQNEIMTHIEIMEECGDICWVGEKQRHSPAHGIK